MPIAPDPLVANVRKTLDRLRGELIARRDPAGHWRGELSASALSTATAVSALSALRLFGGVEAGEANGMISRGLAYLDSQQNADGGYGDTDRSHSNIATSYLVLAARTLADRMDVSDPGDGPGHGMAGRDDGAGRSRAGQGGAGQGGAGRGDDGLASLRAAGMDRLRRYIDSAGGVDGLRARYGKDKTFVVPILTNLAIAGLADWASIPRLPFEAAVFPGSMYRFLQMPVVSYAIPALVAIGQVHHFRGPRTWWPIRQIRAAAVGPTMRVLHRMQPESGGYLEATPLTSFVLMSLAASGRGAHPVSLRCLRFLKDSIRPDGSWPIDTDLATWVTSLAIHGLAQDPSDDGGWATPELVRWHLSCQHQRRHPFTGASPGGWGWTDLSGAVPDGDDTPAAILAISHYQKHVGSPEWDAVFRDAATKGLRWLADLQNRDGGLPTFCRGWGKLPFDRSSTDLTAHFIRGLDVAKPLIHDDHLRRRLQKSRLRANRFLRKQQRDDGSWLPLWFGNQDDAAEQNPVYGTGRVLLAIADDPAMSGQRDRGVDYLLAVQNGDGGWGGGPSRDSWLRRGSERDSASESGLGTAEGVEPSNGASSLEETAVALEGLAAFMIASAGRVMGEPSEKPASPRERLCEQAIIASVRFLTTAVDSDQHREPWPIGFYFAKLWYHERLYPLVLTLAALGLTLRWLSARCPSRGMPDSGESSPDAAAP